MVDLVVQENKHNLLHLLNSKTKFKDIDELELHYINQFNRIVFELDIDTNSNRDSEYIQNSFNLILQHYSYSVNTELYLVIKSHHKSIIQCIEDNSMLNNIYLKLIDTCIVNLTLFDKNKLNKKMNSIKYNLSCFTENPQMFKAKSLYNSAKQRAKDKELEFDLTIDWIYNKLVNGYCEVTNIEFRIKDYTPDSISTVIYPNSPSLDRIDNSKGYIQSNVQVVCDQFNKFKSQYTMEQTYNMAKEFIKQYELTFNK